MAEEAAASVGAESNSIELATELTIAWLNNPNNRAAADDVPAFLRTMHTTLNDLATGTGSQQASEEAEYKPAVSPRSSVKKDRIISLIDGKPYKTLKRHLANHGLTPNEYRERYGLKSDYPMVAPDYSAARSEMARKIGLGSKGRNARKQGAPAAASNNGGSKTTASNGSNGNDARRGKAAAKPAARGRGRRKAAADTNPTS